MVSFRNDLSLLINRHYVDMGGGSKRTKRISLAAQLIKSTIQIGIVARHHYGISAVFAKTLFPGETSDGVAKCRCYLRLVVIPMQNDFSRSNKPVSIATCLASGST